MRLSATFPPSRRLGRQRPAGLPFGRAVGAVLTCGALLLAGIAGAPGASAANPYQRGPSPTFASITAATGPFAITSKVIKVSTFGQYTVYYPTSAPQGKYGVVSIVPGYFARWSQMSWLGPRIASQGFVVIGIDTTSLGNFPAARGDQLKASIATVSKDAAVAAVGDFSRVAVAGWSMGGGGALEVAATTGVKAVIAIAPTNQLLPNNFNQITEPVLFLAAQNDTLAPPASVRGFYGTVTGEKAYQEFANDDHFFTTRASGLQAAPMISWLKRWVDDDTRYTFWLCPGPSVGPFISAAATTCPY